MVEYPQGWLSKGIENTGSVQAAWRTDPQRSGKSGCMADIGTHAAHLAEHVSGLKITHLCANLNIYGEEGYWMMTAMYCLSLKTGQLVF
ncbi:Gfo/Idh/MocA family protein [Sphingobacterium daejeonense]|uniref:Gfo/Idh/MocA family protein n=1 Tax=Sphingobacterium daejeonense TaxID=371142 RepID=UPI0010C24BF6|nr:hypothetical protein [Sphingobacterium daejeonense]VTP95589.1 Uncharacterised protein [Sphingobacterium daejeonense]